MTDVGSEYRWVWRGLAAILILGAAGLHVAYLVHNCPLDLAQDEAHYWDWSRHLDWSYYSKGPLVALLIRAACCIFGPLSESLTGNLALAIRVPAIGCGVLLLTSMYVLTVQTFGRERLAFGLVALALTLPPVAAASTLMTIDAPYLACWGWALVFGHVAAVRGRAWAWPVVGLIVGIGILAKYTMVLWLPSAGLFLLTSAEGRSQLRRPGFWLACGIAAGCCLPIGYWNARNDWVTFRHVGWQAGVERRQGWRWFGPFTYFGEQAALLLGVWFGAWAAAMWEFRPKMFGVRRPAVGGLLNPDTRIPMSDRRTPGIQFLWWLSAPMFAVFLIASVKTSGQLNWPVATYLSGGVLAAAWLSDRLLDPRRRVRRAVRLAGVTAAGLGVGLTVAIHFPAVARPVLVAISGPPTPERPLPLRRFDPSCRLRGGRALAAAVDEARATIRAHGGGADHRGRQLDAGRPTRRLLCRPPDGLFRRRRLRRSGEPVRPLAAEPGARPAGLPWSDLCIDRVRARGRPGVRRRGIVAPGGLRRGRTADPDVAIDRRPRIPRNRGCG